VTVTANPKWSTSTAHSGGPRRLQPDLPSAPAQRLRVFVLGGEPLTRFALRRLLNGWQGRTVVVGEAADPAAAARALPSTAADLVLMDAGGCGSPNLVELAVLAQNLSRPGAPRTLLLIGSEQDQTWLTALRPTLHGTVHRSTDLTDLLIAVHAVGRGATYLDARQPPHEASESRTHAPLTPRETDVLTQITLGRTNNEIGQALSISPTTVKFHVSGLLRKFDVKRRSDLAYIAGRRGMR
jgi:DNA-binding NarL/FixJ family response regulator